MIRPLIESVATVWDETSRLASRKCEAPDLTLAVYGKASRATPTPTLAGVYPFGKWVLRVRGTVTNPGVLTLVHEMRADAALGLLSKTFPHFGGRVG